MKKIIFGSAAGLLFLLSGCTTDGTEQQLAELRQENQQLQAQVDQLTAELNQKPADEPGQPGNGSPDAADSYFFPLPSTYASPVFSVAPSYPLGEYHLDLMAVGQEFHRILLRHAERPAVMDASEVAMLKAYDPMNPPPDKSWIRFRYDRPVQLPLSDPAETQAETTGVRTTDFAVFQDKATGELSFNVYLSDRDKWAVYPIGGGYEFSRLDELNRLAWTHYSEAAGQGEGGTE